VHGFPAPRITYSPHSFEEAAAAYYGAKLQAICQAAPGATGSFGGFGDGPTRHVLGTARMGRSAERLQEVAKKLSTVESLVLPADLAKPADVDRVASEALARFGRVDILLANAGLDRSAAGDPERGEPMREAAIDNLADLLSPGHPAVVRLGARERVDLDLEPPPL